MRSITGLDLVRVAATAIVMLATIGPTAAQFRPQLQVRPPATMAIPRPSPEIGLVPVLPVPESTEPRSTERVCIEKEMCVDVPASPQGPPSSDARK